MEKLGLESFTLNAVTLLASITLAIANTLVMIRVKRNSDPIPRKSASFVKSQTTLYLLSNIFFILFTTSQIISTTVPAYNVTFLKEIISWGTNITATSLYFLGIWFFTFKNWVISREMPRVLLENGGGRVRFCIPLDWLNEGSYKKINWFVAGLGLCIFFA